MIKIFVVEDDISIRSTLCEYLRLADYEVSECSDGSEALRQFVQSRPDLVVLDIMLPGMSGLEILRRIRQKDTTTPVIVLTALGDEEDQVSAYDAKADDYVVKPFSIPVFLKKIESLLRRCGKLRGEELIYGDLRIDVSGYMVFWQGRQLELTVTEFELLKTLVQHHGQILTRSQLLDQVWGFDYIGEERIVDAHIKNLRHKLPQNIVSTAKGIGYYIQ